MVEQMLEAWHTNNRINLFLIDHISDEGLRCTLSARGGETSPGNLRTCMISACGLCKPGQKIWRLG